MVQFEILSGSRRGETISVASFPFTVGRSGGNHLRIVEPGVWDDHLSLARDEDTGFQLSVCPGAGALVNGETATARRLRNGDLVEAGSLKLRFWLAPPAPRGRPWRELLVWLTLGVLVLIELGLILWLPWK